ncbi:hypothetical protein LTS10_005455 [Elasticomyces elasticus]|nr:hypothetical protein LTS10_005455 [Elasticomyces elasticus]
MASRRTSQALAATNGTSLHTFVHSISTMTGNKYDDATIAKLTPVHQSAVPRQREWYERTKSRAAAGDPEAYAAMEVRRQTNQRAKRRASAKRSKARGEGQEVPERNNLLTAAKVRGAQASDEIEYVRTKSGKRTELRRSVSLEYVDADEGQDNRNVDCLVNAHRLLSQPPQLTTNAMGIHATYVLRHERPLLKHNRELDHDDEEQEPPSGLLFRRSEAQRFGVQTIDVERIPHIPKQEAVAQPRNVVDLCSSEDEASPVIKVETPHEQAAASTTQLPAHATGYVHIAGTAGQAGVVGSRTMQVASRSPAEIRLLIRAKKIA